MLTKSTPGPIQYIGCNVHAIFLKVYIFMEKLLERKIRKKFHKYPTRVQNVLFEKPYWSSEFVKNIWGPRYIGNLFDKKSPSPSNKKNTNSQNHKHINEHCDFQTELAYHMVSKYVAYGMVSNNLDSPPPTHTLVNVQV